MSKILTGDSLGKHIERALLDAKKRIYVVSPFISKDYVSIMIRKAMHGAEVKIVTSEPPYRKFTTELLKIYSGVPLPEVRISKRESLLYLLFSAAPAATFMASYFMKAYFLLPIGAFLSIFLLIIFKEGRYLRLLGILIGVLSLILAYYLTRNGTISLFYLGFSTWAFTAILASIYRIKDVKKLISPSFIENYQLEAFGPPRKVLEVKFVPEKKFVHSKIYVFDDVGFIGSANLTYASLWKNVETIEIFEGEEVDKVVREFEKVWDLV